MPLRNGKPFRLIPRGLSDSLDGTNAFAGAMASLANLVQAPHTLGIFVPRPAAVQETVFAGFTAPDQVEAVIIVGDRAYGFVQSGRFAGHSEPYCFDYTTGAFVTISGVTAGNTPVSTANTGDWTPPTVCNVGSRVVFTHPGFSGSNFFGWLDLTGFSDGAKTGSTHTTTSITGLSADVLQAGWAPGMSITDSASDIPAGTRIADIAADGLSLTLSAAATGSNAGTTLTVSGGTAAAPLWCAGNTAVNHLPSVPVAVAQFFGRAYFACGRFLPFSDSGNAVIASNSRNVQAVGFANGLSITALRGFPLGQTQGGILQALIAFQGVGAIQQITGDDAFQNLSTNELIEGSGTLAPNAVWVIPQIGMAFIAPDGLRYIDFGGRVSDPIGANGEGVQQPFVNAITPSRICGAYNEDVYRVSVTSQATTGGVILSQAQTLEYWFHVKLKAWSGPHSFPAALIAPRQDGSGFLIVPTAAPSGLWSSDTLPNLTSTYVENGVALGWTWQPCLMPDSGDVKENALVDATVALAQTAGTNVTVTGLDQRGVVLDTITLTLPATVWGGFSWGGAAWGGSSAFQQRSLDWNLPLVFKQMSVRLTGTASQTFAIGNLYLNYIILGYKLMEVA